METSVEVWSAIKTMFASQSKARLTNLRILMANTKKEKKSAPQYFVQMKGYADELVAAGKPLDEDKLVAYILRHVQSDLRRHQEQPRQPHFE